MRLYWCPNKCGKRVYAFPRYSKKEGHKYDYNCDRCNKKFTKEQIHNYNFNC